jgi:cold shock CspA family protein
MVASEPQALIDALKQLDDTTAVLVITQVLQDKPELAPPIVTFAVPDLTYPPTKVLTERRCKGSIKSFSSEKEFGLIECEELSQIFGGDVFLHGKQCVIDHPLGTKVSFAVVLSKDNQPQAFDVIKDTPAAAGARAPVMPSMGAMSGMQSMPGMTSLPGIAGMQGMQGMPALQGMQGMSGNTAQALPAMQGMDAMAAMSGLPGMGGMGNNAAAMMQMMAGKAAGAPAPALPPPPATTAAAPSLGQWNGTIKSFDPKQGCGFIQCPDLQAQGYASDVFLSHQELGQFEIGAQVSFTAFLNGTGQPEARQLVQR